MVIAGAIVQMVSIICPSMMKRLVRLFWMILIIVYITVVMIINIIINTWLWKRINCSVIGDVLSCNLRFNHVIVGAYIQCTRIIFVSAMVGNSEYLRSTRGKFCNHSTEFLVCVGIEFVCSVWFFLI